LFVHLCANDGTSRAADGCADDGTFSRFVLGFSEDAADDRTGARADGCAFTGLAGIRTAHETKGRKKQQSRQQEREGRKASIGHGRAPEERRVNHEKVE